MKFGGNRCGKGTADSSPVSPGAARLKEVPPPKTGAAIREFPKTGAQHADPKQVKEGRLVHWQPQKEPQLMETAIQV